MRREIQTTHDLARWIQAMGHEPADTVTVTQLIESLLQGPPETWKICKKCDTIQPISNYDDRLESRDGKAYICKKCRRKQAASYGRRKRARKKINPANFADLAEIQRVRGLMGKPPQ